MSLPRTTIEQRSRFYEDVEALLSPGFLTHGVVVAGVRLQVRSLFPGDLFMLRARTDGVGHQDWRTWMVASSVWMVDGHSVLGQEAAVPLLAQSLWHLPHHVRNMLFSLVLGLFSRSQRALEAITTYCYEGESRYKWITIGRGQGQASFGIPGVPDLGMNTVQQIWWAYNQHEDQRLRDDQQWNGFKLVASTNAPKAVKKIDESDRNHAQAEQDRREAALDTFYYTLMGVITPEDKRLLEGGHRFQTKSVDDLEDEMRRWVTGDADIHDRVVNEYKERIRAEREQARQEQESRRAALQAERIRLEQEAAEEGVMPQPLLALTAEQLQRMLSERGQQGRPGVAFIPVAPHADRLYTKYLAEGAVTSGQVQVVDGKVVDPQTDAQTLNQLIQGRRPAFRAGS